MMYFEQLSGEDERIAKALLAKDYQITTLLAARLAHDAGHSVLRTERGLSITLPDTPAVEWEIPQAILDGLDWPTAEDPTVPTPLGIAERWGALGKGVGLDDELCEEQFSIRSVAVVVEPDQKLAHENMPNGLPNRGNTDEKQWSTSYINDLPDSAFLLILPGGEKDEDGKTTPRELRKLPYKDKDGKVDLPHLRNAISRANQVQDAQDNRLPASKVEEIRERARGILAEQTGKKEVTKEEDCAILCQEGFINKAISTVKSLFAKKKSVPDNMNFFTIKEGDRYRWVAVSSTAFRDKEQDIISVEAYEKDLERRSEEGDYGPLLFWHVPAELGRCDYRMIEGVCLVESGLWNDDDLGEAARKAVEKDPTYWGVSIGFLYNNATTDKDVQIKGTRVRNLIKDIRTVERSVLPQGSAASLFTMIASEPEGEAQMDQKKKEALRKLLLNQDDLVDTVEQRLDSINAKALSGDILFKDVETLEEKLTILANHLPAEEATTAVFIKAAIKHIDDPTRVVGYLEDAKEEASEQAAAVLDTLIGEVEVEKEVEEEDEVGTPEVEETVEEVKETEEEEDDAVMGVLEEMAKEFAALKTRLETMDAPPAAAFFRPTEDDETVVEKEKKDLEPVVADNTETLTAMANSLQKLLLSEE